MIQHESSFPSADQYKVWICTQKPPNTSTDSQIYRRVSWVEQHKIWVPPSLILADLVSENLPETHSECIPQKTWPKTKSRRVQTGEEPCAASSDVCFSLLLPIKQKHDYNNLFMKINSVLLWAGCQDSYLSIFQWLPSEAGTSTFWDWNIVTQAWLVNTAGSKNTHDLLLWTAHSGLP